MARKKSRAESGTGTTPASRAGELHGFRRAGLSLADAFQMPRDVVLNLPRISLVGNLQIVVENFHGVVEYTEEQVRVALVRGQLLVTGRELAIAYVHSEDILITGFIDRVEFVG